MRERSTPQQKHNIDVKLGSHHKADVRQRMVAISIHAIYSDALKWSRLLDTLTDSTLQLIDPQNQDAWTQHVTENVWYGLTRDAC